MQAQVLREMNLLSDQALVVKINVDERPEIARQYSIQSIPTMLVFRNGRLQHRQVGLADADKIRDMLKR